MEQIAESAINQKSNIQVPNEQEKVLNKNVVIEGDTNDPPKTQNEATKDESKNLIKKAIEDVKTINWKQLLATQFGMFISLFFVVFIMLTYFSPPFVRIQKEHGHSYYSVQKTLIYSLLFSSLMFVIPFILKHWGSIQEFIGNFIKMFKSK